jgi:hypothetical protein
MNKELPYIDDNNQLHYEAYFGTGRSFLRSALPADHPEHLCNYLEKHGIDWKLFFDEAGNRKGIDHEHGPADKLFNSKLSPKQYDEKAMERAFNGGGANAAKLRVSNNKLTLPVLDFKQWLIKYNNDQAVPGLVEVAGIAEKMFLCTNESGRDVTSFLNESFLRKKWNLTDKSALAHEPLSEFLDTAKLLDTWSSEELRCTLKMIGTVYLSPTEK